MIESCPLVDNEGLPLIQWIHFISGSCVYGNLSALSWVVQYFSVGVWVFSGTYQSWLCYKTKEVSGFSEYFLLCWIIGAVLNTMGCFLADQMFFQKLLGVYFFFSDSFLYFQYKYYIARPHLAAEVLEKERRKSISFDTKYMASSEITIERTKPIAYSNLSSSSSSSATTITPGILLGLAMTPSGASAAPIGVTAKSGVSFTSVFMAATQVLGSANRTFSTSKFAGVQSWHALGYFIGNSASWMSNGLYVVSRIPQIRQNYIRKSTDGVSPALFIAVLVGNAAYTLAVATAWQAITDPTEKSKFVIAEMPFIVGGVLTTLMDLVIFVQLYIYRNNTKALTYEVVEGVRVERDETSPLMGDAVKKAMYS